MFSSRVSGASAALLVLVATACSTATYNAAPLRPVVPSESRALDVGLRSIGPNALQAQGDRPLADVIQFYWSDVLNPPWRSLNPLLRALEPLGVYSNGASMGDLASLRNIPAARIARVRRLTPVEEQMEFGRQHASGALVVEWAKL